MQTITRSTTFDSGHRVMNERMKCFNLHGHTYKLDVEVECMEMQEIGYAIDFKEIKRVGLQFVDDMFDHGMILNPMDKDVIALCESIKTKMWLMSLEGNGEYCNPTVENIARELFLCMQFLIDQKGLKVRAIVLHETPNCSTRCERSAITPRQYRNFAVRNGLSLENYKQAKGVIEYDDRKANG